MIMGNGAVKVSFFHLKIFGIKLIILKLHF